MFSIALCLFAAADAFTIQQVGPTTTRLQAQKIDGNVPARVSVDAFGRFLTAAALAVSVVAHPLPSLADGECRKGAVMNAIDRVVLQHCVSVSLVGLLFIVCVWRKPHSSEHV